MWRVVQYDIDIIINWVYEIVNQSINLNQSKFDYIYVIQLPNFDCVINSFWIDLQMKITKFIVKKTLQNEIYFITYLNDQMLF